MARHGRRPSFSDQLKLLDVMGDVRSMAIMMGAAAGYNSDRHRKTAVLKNAIDIVAEEITGDANYFHGKGSSTPGAGSRPIMVSFLFKGKVADALHRFIDEQAGEKPMLHGEAIEALVVDHLIALGFVAPEEPPPENPKDAN